MHEPVWVRIGGYVTVMSGRALEFAAPREVRVVEVEVADPRPDEIVVRTRFSGISTGTELLAYRGEIDPNLPLDETIGSLGGTFSYPFRYGYSCVGIVESSQGDLPLGTVVFVLHPHQDRFVCRAADAVVVDGIDARSATMLPLVETALQIVLDAGNVFGQTVVVMGLGSVGLLTAALLQRAGAQVIAIEPRDARRALACELDLDAFVPGEAVERVSAATSDRGVGLVVEASGAPDALSSSLPLLAHEGTALVASWYGTKPVALSLGAEFHRRRLTIRSTQVSSIPARLASRWTISGRRAASVRLLTELPLKKLATHEFPFDRAADAFAALDRGDDDLIHSALAYRT